MRRKAYFIVAMVLALTISFMLLPSQAVQAAGVSYYVDDDNCPGPGNGTQANPFCSIQSGIDAASSGDTVQVAAGTYYENITMKSGVVIQGAGQGVSIIDGGGNGSVVTAIGVDSAATLDGFTLTGGHSDFGGGMYIYNNSSPTVTNCTLIGNTANDHGGGMYIHTNSSPTVTNCTLTGNTANDYGGGMYLFGSCSPTVTNCILTGNIAAAMGGGIYDDNNCSPTVINCTFSGNSASSGGGIASRVSSFPTVTNSILWGDSPSEIYNEGSSPTVSYSDIEGDYTGTGNIDADPLFVGGGDYHLTSDSPCIDTGTSSGAPATDLEGNPRPQGAGYDMGVYESLFAKLKAMPWILLLLGD